MTKRNRKLYKEYLRQVRIEAREVRCAKRSALARFAERLGASLNGKKVAAC